MLDQEKRDFPKITVILRGYTYDQVHCVVEQMIHTKLQAIEVAMNTPNAMEIISNIQNEFGNDILVGAGTVTSVDRAKKAAKAGARFMLSPIAFNSEIFNICKNSGILTVPSGFTPSEIWKMFEMGADIVKVFPAIDLKPRYFSDIQAPLDAMPLMVVGGVNANNVQQFFEAGASFAGIGSGIFNKADILSMNKEALKNSIKEFETKVSL
jgi:2-dehydro-3-deoxyphosphogluconate aldolase/(4S)-4-hydroxy-2-oxoglutarate aldolase